MLQEDVYKKKYGEEQEKFAYTFLALVVERGINALVAAVGAMRERMAIVSVERVRDELQKMLLLPDPRPGFLFLSSTGLLADVLPAIAAQGLDADRVAALTVAVTPEPADRWAAASACPGGRGASSRGIWRWWRARGALS